MAVLIKSDNEIQKMRVAGKLTSDVLKMIEKMILPGTVTDDIDRVAEDFIRHNGGIPTFLNYREFPKSVCISINEEVIHGIPGARKLKSGDIVSVDIGAMVNGFHGDAARTFICGEGDEKAKKLVEITEKCFFEGIKYAKNGCHLYQISQAVQYCAESNGFSVVKDYVGHGIGRMMHEDPAIPNYKPPGRGLKLQTGMTLAIEPMVNAGTYEIEVKRDKWTVVTKDGRDRKSVV